MPVGGDSSSPSSRRGPVWLKGGIWPAAGSLAVSQPLPCHCASFLPGTKVLDGLVEPQVPKIEKQAGSVPPSQCHGARGQGVRADPQNEPARASPLPSPCFRVLKPASSEPAPCSCPCFRGCVTLAGLGELVPGQTQIVRSLLSHPLGSALRGQGRSRECTGIRRGPADATWLNFSTNRCCFDATPDLHKRFHK